MIASLSFWLSMWYSCMVPTFLFSKCRTVLLLCHVDVLKSHIKIKQFILLHPKTIEKAKLWHLLATERAVYAVNDSKVINLSLVDSRRPRLVGVYNIFLVTYPLILPRLGSGRSLLASTTVQ